MEKKNYYQIKQDLLKLRAVIRNVDKCPEVSKYEDQHGNFQEKINKHFSETSSSSEDAEVALPQNTVAMEINEERFLETSSSFDNDEDVVVSTINNNNGPLSSPLDNLGTFSSSSSDTNDGNKLTINPEVESKNSEDGCINGQLIKWYNDYNITLSSFKVFLSILKPFHPFLQADPRTLLKTKSSVIEKNDNGDFFYFGIKENIIKSKIDFSNMDSIKLDMNVDGFQVFKSCKKSFWPILCAISNTTPNSNCNKSCPFVVALFYGTGKPQIKQFLSKFIVELKYLMQFGVEVDGKILLVELRYIIADAPAKAFLKQCKRHGGYWACDRCEVKVSGIKKLHPLHITS